MFYYNEYVRAQSVEEAYTLAQAKNNVVAGGMLWLKMQNRTVGKLIDLCDLGLDKIEEIDTDIRIGAYVSLRALEKNERLNELTNGAITEALKHIVGVQFRNVATVGGSIWGKFGFSDVLTLFMALDAKVSLYKAGTISIEEYVALPRTTRDILTEIIIPKDNVKVSYYSQRNSATDFPTLTCAVAKDGKGYSAVIGARPHLAMKVCDVEGILKDSVDENSAKDFGEYVASKLDFGDNMRAGAAYRKKICEVLVRRAVMDLVK